MHRLLEAGATFPSDLNSSESRIAASQHMGRAGIIVCVDEALASSTLHEDPHMNRIDYYAHLRVAYAAGARIQAWHLDEQASNSAQGHWDTLPRDREPAFSCPAHLYRVHPDDLGAGSSR